MVLLIQNKFKVLTKTRRVLRERTLFVLNDELHAQEKHDMYDNLKSAQVISLGTSPWMLNISTRVKVHRASGMRDINLQKKRWKKHNDDPFICCQLRSKQKGMTDG